MSTDIKLPFIPAWLDDARLSPNAFRVLCHLWRRRNHKTGKCNPTVYSEDPERETITKVCGMNRNAVHRALKELSERNAATRIRHFKRSSDYQLGAITYCPEIVTIKQDEQLSRYRAGNGPEIVTNNCPDIVTQEGIPSEGNPKEGIPSISSPAVPAVGVGIISPVGDSPKPQPITPEEIFAAYPRQMAKNDALKAIKAALKGADPEHVLTATKAYARATSIWKTEDKKFIPAPAKWYASGRYDDDPKEWNRDGRQPLDPKYDWDSPEYQKRQGPPGWRELLAKEYPDCSVVTQNRPWSEVPDNIVRKLFGGWYYDRKRNAWVAERGLTMV
jgi:hypothetical protein